MLLAHKIEIRPTNEQEQFFGQACGSSRHLWNNMVTHFSNKENKFSKKAAREFYYTIRKDFEWYNNLSANIFQTTIDNLESGFKGFFKSGKGFPKLKKKGVKDSFGITSSAKFSIKGKELRLEKFNKSGKTKPILLRERVRFTGKPKQVRISKSGGKWFASILVEVESGYNMKQPISGSNIGVDLGIKTLVTTSNGDSIGKSNKLYQQLNNLAKLQQKLSKQIKGSNRRAKTKRKINKLHFYVTQKRKALLHSVSDSLTSNYEIICMEDLDVKGMLEKSNNGLSRMISDVGMYELKRQVVYKSFLRGGKVLFVDQYYPSSKTCSYCGVVKQDLKLSDRVYNCGCGLYIDRDLNAARNILKEGLKQL